MLRASRYCREETVLQEQQVGKRGGGARRGEGAGSGMRGEKVRRVTLSGPATVARVGKVERRFGGEVAGENSAGQGGGTAV